MSKTAHWIYLSVMILTIALALIVLTLEGIEYYQTILEERFFHPDHNILKSSGIIGHGLGIFGTLLIIIGVFGYMARKRFRVFGRLGLLKYWLEFHIFLCTLGPIMVLFHTAFKFGGIVAISFWSMVAVFLSGIIGRFIYIQIPRTIEGRELSLSEVREMKADFGQLALSGIQLDTDSYNKIIASTRLDISEEKNRTSVRSFSFWLEDRKALQNVYNILKNNNIPKNQSREIINLVKGELSLNRRIGRLQLMQNLFKYWHVAHLPFALVMLVIMIIHVAVTLVFGFKWIL